MSKKRRYKNSGYSESSASVTKQTLKSWFPKHYSAVSDIDYNLATLRDRSYSLSIGSPVGSAMIKTFVSGVVNEGLKLFPRLNHTALGLTIDEARSWEERTKQEFELWSENIECDYYRRNTFRELQRIAFTNQLVDGDSFCLFRRRSSASQNPYSLRLQLIEAGRVSNPVGFEMGRYVDGQIGSKKNYQSTNLMIYQSNVEMLKGNSRIVNGVEVDNSGVLKALWIANKIFNELSTTKPITTWQRVKVFGERSGEQNLCFLCNDSRIEQFRGEPILSPVIEIIKNISRYSDSELTSAILKTYFSLFFTQTFNDRAYGLNQILPNAKQETELDLSRVEIGPGTLTDLPPGVDVKSVSPAGAASTFESFTVQLLKQVGAAVNLPYEVLLKNFQSSYSASKAALLQAENEFRQRRQAFIVDFCEPIYKAFLAEAVALGRIDAPGFFEDALQKKLWTSADWNNETSHALDIQKEIQAAEKKIALGLSTYTKESALLNGSDFTENLKQLAKEKKLMAELLGGDKLEILEQDRK